MKESIQDKLFTQIKSKINPGDTLGHELAEVLSISLDASYRRLRMETLLTIEETKKLCKHYDISFDAIIEVGKGNAIFSYAPLESFDFTLESYLEGILNAMNRLIASNDPKIYLCINNAHFFQMLNFPQLVRFRLYFWAKSHLLIPSYQNEKFKHEKITERAFELGWTILQKYNSIPTVEIVDLDLINGFMRQVIYYLEAGLFEDPSYALFLTERAELFISHFKTQAQQGKKFMIGNDAPAQGNNLSLYMNETINTDATFIYESKQERGVYLTHNIMNYLHTSNEIYFKDSMQIMERQIINSSLISEVNEKQRNAYFTAIEKKVHSHKKTIQDLL